MDLWKPIPEYDSYEASLDGQIRNKKTKKVLSPCNVEDGYSQVRLSLGARDKYKVCRVHRLVASAWISNPGNKPTVNHKNRDKFDNRVVNLEWADNKEQAQHFAETGTRKKRVVYDRAVIENEQWANIDTNPGYMISNMGRVKNCSGRILNGYSGGRYIQIRATPHIYPHRAVAKAFLPSFSSDCVVNHINGERHDNRLENLECITQKENVLHAYDMSLNPRRVPIQKYSLTGELLKEYKSFTEAAKESGCTDGAIRWCIKHADGKHGGFLWKRL